MFGIYVIASSLLCSAILLDVSSRRGLTARDTKQLKGSDVFEHFKVKNYFKKFVIYTERNIRKIKKKKLFTLLLNLAWSWIHAKNLVSEID